jgi:hypothetical protein
MLAMRISVLALEGVFDLHGRSKFLCTTKQGVLQKMGNPFLAGRVVAPASLQVDSKFCCMQMGHFHADDPQAIGKGMGKGSDHVSAFRIRFIL